MFPCNYRDELIYLKVLSNSITNTKQYNYGTVRSIVLIEILASGVVKTGNENTEPKIC